MSKMKHLFRKFHLGGGGGALAEPHQLHDGSAGEASTAAATSSTSPSSAAASAEQQTSVAAAEAAAESVDNSGSVTGANAGESVPDYGLLEEEFQVQLAMAMSASDSDSRSLSLSLEDPETTAQITAAKQISLGCSTSQSLVDFQSLRYWNYDVVNYNEKVLDGFYDVFGINTNFLARGKMPSLVELQSIPVVGNVDYEAIIVDRTADVELRSLEEKVHLMASEYQTLRMGALMGFFVQKIANIVVEKMGGPVNDAEEMLRRWTTRSYEMRTLLNTITLPIGSLNVGLSRQRALLFKVLADRINLPCMLVKGSYYTSTDDGAFSIIKFDDGSEYIIDLMGAPGTLIPSEIPSGQLQNCGLDLRTISPIAETFDGPHYGFGGPNRTLSMMPGINVPSKINCSNSEQFIGGMEFMGNRGSALEDGQTEQFKHEFGRVIPSLLEIADSSTYDSRNRSTASEIHVDEFSKNVFYTPKNPVIARGVEPVLSYNRGELSPENSNQSPLNLGQQESMEKSLLLLKDEKVSDGQGREELCQSNNEKSLLPLSELRFLNYTLYSPDVNSSSPVMAGQSQGVMESEDALVRAESDQNYENNDVVLMKRKGISDSIQSHLNSRDEQVDAMLGGVAEWEIPWEDLHIGERIGIGSYGEVYRSDWNGTEVAVKKFMNQDISGDALFQFKCEVEIMLRLRHPNVVLFMGAVTRPPNLSILTEFLPRGSLFKLLHRSHVQIDERRRLRMALDVAKGMNYLHTSNPVIVHRDLKTPNLLVDKNWVVKVCDFGMSRMKHHTFLSSKSAAGTAEWMAPEVLRNEPSSEKSDVFSFGVILWELATMDVPWTGMNSMQVVGAVGFQGRRLTIPDRIDSVVAEIIRNCWDSNQHERPSFKEIIARLKTLQRLVVKRTDTVAQQP